MTEHTMTAYMRGRSLDLHGSEAGRLLAGYAGPTGK